MSATAVETCYSLPVVPQSLDEDLMKRRAFLVATAMLATATRRAIAQQSAKMKRVAIMHPAIKVEDQRIGSSSDPGFTFLWRKSSVVATSRELI